MITCNLSNKVFKCFMDIYNLFYNSVNVIIYTDKIYFTSVLTTIPYIVVYSQSINIELKINNKNDFFFHLHI
jgi:hypothetical protein